MRHRVAVLLLPTVLAGCASTMSGLDGGSQFACKAPDGVTCSSLSGVYANAVANNLPALRKGQQPEGRGTPRSGGPERSEEWAAGPQKGGAKDSSIASAGDIVGRAPSSGDSIRSQPKVLRIWIAPWEDSEGDLHDQSYVYVVADAGRWVIEHNQKRIVDRYRPTFIQAAQGASAQKPASQPSLAAPAGGVTLPGAQIYGPGNASQTGAADGAGQ